MNARRRRPERVVALFVTVFWAAVVFAVDGLLSILLDADPIVDGVGPYYSILAFIVAGFALWMLLSGTSRSHRPVFGSVAAAASVYLAFLIVALPWGIGLVAQQALSPFVLTACIAAAAAVIATWFVLRQLRWRRR